MIIAGHEYESTDLDRLRAPLDDAAALNEVFGDPDIGGFDVTSLINESSTVVASAMEDFFADRSADDLLLLHFSGHGVKDVTGDLYFAAANTRMDRLETTAVSADFVHRLMNRSRSRRIVLLLDCCYSGAFERGMGTRADASVEVASQLGGKGRAVITASTALEYAFEAHDLTDLAPQQPSVFTGAVVDGLRTGEADLDGDGLVSLDELYDFVFDRVRERTSSQTPSKWTFGIQGDLHIARSAHRTEGAHLPSGRASVLAAETGRPVGVPAPDTVRTADDAAGPANRWQGVRTPRPQAILAGAGAVIVLGAAAAGLFHLHGDENDRNPARDAAGPSASGSAAAATGKATPGSVILQDDLSHPSHWPDSGADANGGHFANGGYVVTARSIPSGGYRGGLPDGSVTAVHPAPDDISVQVDGRLLSSAGTTGYGVECHATTDLDGYVFSIWNKTAYLGKLAGGTPQSLDPVDTSIIRTDGVNHMKAECTDAKDHRSTYLQFWINGRKVISYRDTSKPLLSGSVALVAGTSDEADHIQAQFDHFLVSRA